VAILGPLNVYGGSWLTEKGLAVVSRLIKRSEDEMMSWISAKPISAVPSTCQYATVNQSINQSNKQTKLGL